MTHQANTRDTLSTLMNLVDRHVDELSDGAYLDICRMLQTVHSSIPVPPSTHTQWLDTGTRNRWSLPLEADPEIPEYPSDEWFEWVATGRSNGWNIYTDRVIRVLPADCPYTMEEILQWPTEEGFGSDDDDDE